MNDSKQKEYKRKYFIHDRVHVGGFDVETIVGYRSGTNPAYMITGNHGIKLTKELINIDCVEFNVGLDYLNQTIHIVNFNYINRLATVEDENIKKQRNYSVTKSDSGLFCIECKQHFPFANEIYRDGKCFCGQCKKFYSWKY